MKRKFFFLFFFVTLFCLGIVSSSNQLVEVNYDFNSPSSLSKVISFQDVLLRVHTTNNAVCKYSLLGGLSYDSMENFFGFNLETIHEESLLGLVDGVHKYYIKCMPEGNFSGEPSEMMIDLKVNSLVTATVSLSEDSPLKAGPVDITLSTSKDLASTPQLMYSFDDVSYYPLALTGGNKVWKGYLVIKKDLGEAPLSFRFKGVDLQGRQGTEIVSGNLYSVDTIPPKAIRDFKAIPLEGEIELKWFTSDEDIKKFRIYRSTIKGVDNMDFYQEVDDGPFYDLNVDDGETYYYRISAVDKAGNEGEFSLVTFSTPLLNGGSVEEGGLNPSLVGGVNNFIIELDSFSDEVDKLKKDFSSKEGDSKEAEEILGISEDVDGVKRSLSSLKNSVEKYKLQDLTEEELSKKLDSARLKLSIMQKSLPESIFILDSSSGNFEISEESVRKVLLGEYPSLGGRELEKKVKDSLKVLESAGFKGDFKYLVAEVDYYDGSKKDYSIVSRRLDSSFERNDAMNYVEIIPLSLLSSGSVHFLGSNYKILNGDSTLVSVGVDSKEFKYYFDRKISISDLESINVGFLLEDVETNTRNAPLTGGFIFSSLEKDQRVYGIVIISIFVFLFLYFLYSRSRRTSKKELSFRENVDKALSDSRSGNFSLAKKEYDSIKKNYSLLSKSEKKRVYSHVEHLKDSILIGDFNEALSELEKTKDKNILKRLENIYSKLSPSAKKKITGIFDKIKERLKNEE